MNFLFIADFFSDQVLGGGELNNEELILILKQDHSVKKIQSHILNSSFVTENKKSFFIVSNFMNLSDECKSALMKTNYVIYEHDHKYLLSRNPANYENYLAPKDQIVNFDFYKNAKAVFCQSQFHCDIVKSNLGLNNIKNLSGNLWSERSLDFMHKVSKENKNSKCAVLRSSIEHKNTFEAELFCKAKKIPYNLISSEDYYDFLSILGTHSKFVFFPKTPETLSRIVVEARMMGLSIIVNKNIGATRESWYSLKGPELIDEVRKMRNRIPKMVVESYI